MTLLPMLVHSDLGTGTGEIIVCEDNREANELLDLGFFTGPNAAYIPLHTSRVSWRNDASRQAVCLH